MPDISYEILTRFFRDHLPFTPTPAQIADFQGDLRLVSPFLMEAALMEVRAGTQGYLLVYRPNEWRKAIFDVYNRKVAEHAQLFPMFHSFETAFRSTLAVVLEQHYQHARWWAGVHAELFRGGRAKNITHVGAVPLNRRAAYRIGQIIKAIDGDSPDPQGKLVGLSNGYEFIQCCYLSHLAQLVEEHWTIFAPLFAPLSFNDFASRFDRVRECRNDVYHHKSAAGMNAAVSAAEELLDCMDFSLAFVCDKIAHTQPVPLNFAVAIQNRHRVW